jgi:methyl-accepting chemotaxis protein
VLEDCRADTRAVIEVIDAIGSESTTTRVLESAIFSVKRAFGMDYGACWMIDRDIQATSFRVETNSLGPAYDLINQTDHYQKGKGITGRTWAAADVIFVQDLSVIKESKLVDTARAAGAVSALSVPFIVDGEVAGVLFFMSFRTIYPSAERLQVLRDIGRLIGRSYKRLVELELEVERQQVLRDDADRILAIVQAARRGDLTQKIPACRDQSMSLVAEGLGSFLTGLRNSLRSIHSTAETLTSQAGQLNTMSSAMEVRAEETSAHAAAVTDASKEVSENIQSISSGSAEMVTSIQELSVNAQHSSDKFKSAVRSATAARQMMGRLTASGKDIGAIVKVVNSIARETNLLALNAAIEAARAGAAGRTFMVVSNEVKELAREAAGATERIAEKVQVIQQDTAHAVESIAEITSIVDEVSKIAEIIASTVEEQAATTSEIGRNVGEIATGSSSIAKKIAVVADVARGARQEAGQTKNAAHSLAGLATELNKLVSGFKVD